MFILVLLMIFYLIDILMISKNYEFHPQWVFPFLDLIWYCSIVLRSKAALHKLATILLGRSKTLELGIFCHKMVILGIISPIYLMFNLNYPNNYMSMNQRTGSTVYKIVSTYFICEIYLFFLFPLTLCFILQMTDISIGGILGKIILAHCRFIDYKNIQKLVGSWYELGWNS